MQKLSDKKRRWLENAPAEVLERILSTLGGAEAKEPSAEFPLAGLVHIDGVGQVPVSAIREQAEKA